jgi:hypothetical protein
MKKLASSLPLQDMIRSVINNATEKLAEDEAEKDKKVKKLLSFEKKEHGHIPSVEEEKAEYEKNASALLTDQSYVEKLASACEGYSLPGCREAGSGCWITSRRRQGSRISRGLKGHRWQAEVQEGQATH